MTTSKDPARRRRRLVLVACSIFAVVLTPFALHELLRWDHARSYTGVCGPHATDIPAHACSYAEYVAEFGAGFAGVGLLFVEAFAFLLAALFVSALWGVAAWRSRRRSRGV